MVFHTMWNVYCISTVIILFTMALLFVNIYKLRAQSFDCHGKYILFEVDLIIGSGHTTIPFCADREAPGVQWLVL